MSDPDDKRILDWVLRVAQVFVVAIVIWGAGTLVRLDKDTVPRVEFELLQNRLRIVERDLAIYGLTHVTHREVQGILEHLPPESWKKIILDNQRCLQRMQRNLECD